MRERMVVTVKISSMAMLRAIGIATNKACRQELLRAVQVKCKLINVDLHI